MTDRIIFPPLVNQFPLQVTSADPRLLAGLAIAAGNPAPAAALKAPGSRPAADRPATADELRGMKDSELRALLEVQYPPADQPSESRMIRAAGERVIACPGASSEELPVDRNIGRLALALDRPAGLRLWLIARTAQRGREYLTRSRLRAAAGAYGLQYSDRHLGRILRAGDGLFWHIHTKHRAISLWGPVRVARALMTLARASGREDLIRYTHQGVTYTNLPGDRLLYVRVTGTVQAFRAELYAAWLAQHEGPISRATLSRLFGVTEDTQRQWERLLGKRVQAVENMAKAYETENNATAQLLASRGELPEHAYTYDAFVQSEKGWTKERRLGWQLPNLYITHGVREHPAIGQGRKVRAAARDVLASWMLPVKDLANGCEAGETTDREHRKKEYHADRKSAETARKRGRGGPWLYFQGYRQGRARYEALTADLAQTSLSELSPDEVKRLWRESHRRRRRAA